MPKFAIIPSNKFRKDIKKYIRKKKEMEALYQVIDTLAQEGNLGILKKMKAHKLSGNYSGLWECHVFPDLLIIWEEDEPNAEIYLVRAGSHSELFG